MQEEKSSHLVKVCEAFSENQKRIQNDVDIISKLVNDKFKRKLDFIRRKFNSKRNTNYLAQVDTKRVVEVDFSRNQEVAIFFQEQMKMEYLKNDVTSNFATITDLKEEHEFRFNNKQGSIADSIGTSEISSLITNLNSTYNSFAKHIFQRNSTLTETSSDEDSLFPENDEVFGICEPRYTELVKEADVQLQIIFETSKALNTCLSIKEFLWGPEYLEAERILLLADFKRQQILDKLIASPCDKEETSSNINCIGELSLLDISFSIEENFNLEHNFVFVLIASYQNVAITSEIVHARKDKIICFLKSFHFENLLPDFEIILTIYSMQIKNKLRNYSHESKFHLKEETTICLSPTKLFQKTNNNATIPPKDLDRRRSSFMLLGTTTIRIANITKNLPILLNKVSTCNFFKSNVCINFRSSVKFTLTHSSFLTLGTSVKETVTWNRYWCVVNGYKLKFWKYPTEQDSTQPTECIDLRYSMKSQVEPVDRVLCARPKTLLLKIKNCHGYNMYYLSTDTWSDMGQLQEKVNIVLAGLHYWNCMRC